MLNLTTEQQIIWNDTMNEPYSLESVARRLLAFGTDSDIVEQLTGFSEEDQTKLIDKNIEVYKKVKDLVQKNKSIMSELFDAGRETHLLSDNPDFAFVVRTSLLLSPDSCQLLSK